MKSSKLKLFLFTSILFLQSLNCKLTYGQDSIITINGKVYDAEYPDIYLENIMVVNLSSQQGIFAEGNNTFTLRINKNDTLVISATNYSLKKVCFRDSAKTVLFNVGIPMNRLSVQLKEIMIFQQREWKVIEKDLKSLGYKESDYRLQGAEAWNSPITALYQAFNRKEKSRRKVAQLMNDDARKGLLKEIIHIYNKNKMIDVPEEFIDDFIIYLNLSDAVLQAMTQYELASYIKAQSFDFMASR